jgi:GT2 family glycosyltransferase
MAANRPFNLTASESVTACGSSAQKVVAVVLNWNLAAETRTCVERLLASDYPNLRVIVVDNGSTDGSVDFLRSQFPDVEVLALPKNRGYAAGNNVGITHALSLGAEWVLLVNNDAVLAPDAISRLVEASTPDAGLLMPRVDAHPSGKLWAAGARVRGIYPLPRPVDARELATGHPIEIDYAIGCVLLIRRSVLMTVGLLDERYFMYYEDLDLSARARVAGFRIFVVPSACAAHQVGASLKKDTSRRVYLITRYRTVWCRSQVPGFTAAAWWGALLVGTLRGIVGALLDADRSRAAAIVRGIRDGFREPSPPDAALPGSTAIT